MMPMTSGLMPVRAANAMAAGTMSATAAGLKVPSAVSTEATKKNTQGTTVTRPCTALMQLLTSRSMVPLRFAMPKK